MIPPAPCCQCRASAEAAIAPASASAARNAIAPTSDGNSRSESARFSPRSSNRAGRSVDLVIADEVALGEPERVRGMAVDHGIIVGGDDDRRSEPVHLVQEL